MNKLKRHKIVSDLESSSQDEEEDDTVSKLSPKSQIVIVSMTICVVVLLILIFGFIFLSNASEQGEESLRIIRNLEHSSMFYKAKEIINRLENDGSEWGNPYGFSQSDIIQKDASVWLDLYPASVLPAQDSTVLGTLGREDFWNSLKSMGINVVHTNPLRMAGGIVPDTGDYTYSLDGGYDRISYSVDRLYGTDDQLQKFCSMAKSHGAFIAGDIVPGHTGTGADFHLALMNYKDYPFLYHLIEIKPEDWKLLPSVPSDKVIPPNENGIPGEYVDYAFPAVNLPENVVNVLKEKGYIAGNVEDIMFFKAGTKETDWSATAPILGTDNIIRRWVYLHVFKQGQPSLNWLHPSYAAQRLITGDILTSLKYFGTKILRLDANSLLGIEPKPNSSKAVVKGHPLSPVVSETLAMMIRKFGGWSYEENSLGAEIRSLNNFQTRFGPDLSYDFTVRSGYIYALMSGDTTLLKTQQEIMVLTENSSTMIHSLQNHDELVTGFFQSQDPKKTYAWKGEHVTAEHIESYINNNTFSLAKNYGIHLEGYGGLPTTLCTIILGRLNLTNKINPNSNNDNDDLLTEQEKASVVQLMILPTVYNAFQPGIFQISGWDILGMLQLEPTNSKLVSGQFLTDGDFRWLNRGAYDFMGTSTATSGVTGIPKGISLFGSIPKQLKDPKSYLNQLKGIIETRRIWNISSGTLGTDILPLEEAISFYPITWPESQYVGFVIINWMKEHFQQIVNVIPRLPIVSDTCKSIWPTEELVNFAKAVGNIEVDIDGFSAKVVIC